MQAIRSYIILPVEKESRIHEFSDDNMVFLSVTTEEAFNACYGLVNGLTCLTVADDHWENVLRVLMRGYREKVQFVKFIGKAGQHAFVKKENAFSMLKDGSWALSVNRLRKKAYSLFTDKKIEVDNVDLLFDSNYKGIGVLYDLIHLSESPALREGLEIMTEDDAAVYIARWGGVPGYEKFKTPYNLK
jgi:hypothetical protein